MKFKICDTCRVNKGAVNFHANRTKGRGLQSICKECCKKYMRKYYLTNKDKLLIKGKEYRDSENGSAIIAKYVKSENGKAAISRSCKKYYGNNTESCLKAMKKYSLTDKGKEAKKIANKKYYDNNPVKSRAQGALNRAVKNKQIIKTGCEICGSNKVHGHHDDYLKPLEVRWLCSKHHREWHNINGSSLNG